MARPRKMGRPKNLVPRTVIPIRLPTPDAKVTGIIAASLGLPRAVWARDQVLEGIARHKKRTERL